MGRFAHVLLLATTQCSFGLAALAADLLPRMEPVAPVAHVPAFSWTGFYLGGELGWIQTDPKYTTGALLLGAPFIVTSGSDKNGLTYGIMAGRAGRLARYGTPRLPVIFSRRTASGAARSAGGSATLPIVLCSMWPVAPRSSRTRRRFLLRGSQSAAMTRAWVGRLELVSTTPSRITGLQGSNTATRSMRPSPLCIRYPS